jgi:hypothetical protein
MWYETATIDRNSSQIGRLFPPAACALIPTRDDFDSHWPPKGKCSFLKKRTKRLFPMQSRTFQRAQTPELTKVFCFFSSEKKAFLIPASP